MSFHTLKSTGSSLKNVQIGIDSISNDIANVNTTGYKKQQVTFQEVVNSQGGLGEGLSGTAVNAMTRIFSQGNLRSTGSYTDLAIQGDGLFTLQNVLGEVVYTRAGHFLVDSEGSMVDPAGNYLLSVSGSRITLPADALRVQITPLGEVEVAYDDLVGLEYYDQVQLASFINPSGLAAIGSNNYRETSASGVPNFSTAGQTGSRTSDSVVVSGAIEQANTNLGEALTDLMGYQRSYQAISRTSSAADEVLQTAINLAS